MASFTPGVSVIDSQTGKTLAHVKDLTLRQKVSEAGIYPMALLPGELTDKTFRTIYSHEKEWRVNEFDEAGNEVGVHALPEVLSMYLHTNTYAISPDFSRVVYRDDSGDILVREAQEDKPKVLLERAASNPLSVGWIRWSDSATVAVFVSAPEVTAYQGAVVLLSLEGGQARTLYQKEHAGLAALSPDGKYLAVRHFGLDVVDLTKGGEPAVQTVPVAKAMTTWCIAWSPDSKSIVYDRGRNIEVYSLESKRSTLVGQMEAIKEGCTKKVAFLDNDRVCCSWPEGDKDRNNLVIFDIHTGKRLLKRSFVAGWDWHVFDNGNRIAVEGQ
jgi:hypothetical protein